MFPAQRRQVSQHAVVVGRVALIAQPYEQSIVRRATLPCFAFHSTSVPKINNHNGTGYTVVNNTESCDSATTLDLLHTF